MDCGNRRGDISSICDRLLEFALVLRDDRAHLRRVLRLQILHSLLHELLVRIYLFFECCTRLGRLILEHLLKLQSLFFGLLDNLRSRGFNCGGSVSFQLCARLGGVLHRLGERILCILEFGFKSVYLTFKARRGSTLLRQCSFVLSLQFLGGLGVSRLRSSDGRFIRSLGRGHRALESSNLLF